MQTVYALYLEWFYLKPIVTVGCQVAPVFVITIMGAGFAAVAITRASLFYTDVS